MMRVLVAAAGVLLLAGCAAAAPEPTPTPTTPPPLTIGVGDCLTDVDGLQPVDCTAQHDSEIFGSVTAPDGAFPGQDAFTAQAADECPDYFASFIGVNLPDSALQVGYYFPTETSWAGGDREILCFVVDPAGPVAGTLRGGAR